MKKSKQNNKGPLLFIGFLIAAIVLAVFVKVFYVPTKAYHSDFLKIAIDYPSNYQLEERFGTIVLKDKKGEIIVTRTGTNYDSLEKYIIDANMRYKLEDSKQQKITINDLNGIVSLDQYKSNPSLNNKSYIFYIDHWIYSIFTRSSALYPDLDRVAKSFRYEP